MKKAPFIMTPILVMFLLVMGLTGCDNAKESTSSKPQPAQKKVAQTLSIISGSENQGLEPLIKEFARQQGAQINLHYSGSIDMTLSLSEKGVNIPYDAVWPANSLWITLGDAQKVVKHTESIMRSPVVLGVRQKVAQRLGWIGEPITVSDILTAAKAGELRFAMTSATQSNSGCSAYIGFLYAMAGRPDMLQIDHLNNPELQDKVRNLLSRVDRSSGSSGWLKETVVKHYDRFQGMFNYEAMIIEANQELIQMGREPLYAVYPTDGIMIADSPLGYVDKGNPSKEALFKKLQAYLLSDDVQKRIMDMGRRTGIVGMSLESADKQIFNPDWGIEADRIISPVPTPDEDVIRKALDLYQVSLRKPSCTAYVVDVSGSMQGQGLNDLKAALTMLLDSDQAKRYMLQSSARDVHLIIPFNSAPMSGIKAEGNAPETLNRLLAYVQGLQSGGGTNIYAAAAQALHQFSALKNLEDYFPAIILMTDGRSKGDINLLQKTIDTLPAGADIPIFSITFGNADESQLKAISDITIGRVFSGQNLVKAFRKAKGYN